MSAREYRPRTWPAHVEADLAEVGISKYDTLATMRPKVEALGLTISLSESLPSPIAGETMFHAEVRDRNDPNSVIGQHDSASDYADALAWATSMLLRERRRVNQSPRGLQSELRRILDRRKPEG